MWHSAGMTISALRLSIVMHLPGVVIHKQWPSSMGNSVVSWKSDWMWAHYITWGTTVTSTPSENIGHKFCAHCNWHFAITFTHGSQNAILNILDATDANWCGILTIALSRSHHADSSHEPPAAFNLSHNWFKRAIVIYMLWLTPTSWHEKHTLSRHLLVQIYSWSFQINLWLFSPHIGRNPIEQSLELIRTTVAM